MQEPLEQHTCSDEELGLVEDPKVPHLFALGRGQPDKVTRDHIYCVGLDDLDIYGSYSSGSGRMINIVVEKCIGHDYCLSEQEIVDWFSAKYVFLRTNRIRFDVRLREQESLIRESFG